MPTIGDFVIKKDSAGNIQQLAVLGEYTAQGFRGHKLLIWSNRTESMAESKGPTPLINIARSGAGWYKATYQQMYLILDAINRTPPLRWLEKATAESFPYILSDDALNLIKQLRYAFGVKRLKKDISEIE